MPRKANPELADDDTPELLRSGSRRPSLRAGAHRLFGKNSAAELLGPKRGRTSLESPKEHVNIRLDADIVQAFKSKGRGWQTRVNTALREWLRTRAR